MTRRTDALLTPFIQTARSELARAERRLRESRRTLPSDVPDAESELYRAQKHLASLLKML